MGEVAIWYINRYWTVPYKVLFVCRSDIKFGQQHSTIFFLSQATKLLHHKMDEPGVPPRLHNTFYGIVIQTELLNA